METEGRNKQSVDHVENVSPKELLDEIHETIDLAEEKRLVRKIDWIILPSLSVCYIFFYVCAPHSKIPRIDQTNTQ
jgi:hypothetical protein